MLREANEKSSRMNPPIPPDTKPIDHYRLDVATLLGLELPSECVPGIEASTELLRKHARIVEAFVFPSNANASQADEA